MNLKWCKKGLINTENLLKNTLARAYLQGCLLSTDQPEDVADDYKIKFEDTETDVYKRWAHLPMAFKLTVLTQLINKKVKFLY
jgi:hypothetical protein